MSDSKELIFCFLGFCLSFFVLSGTFVHVKGLQSEKAQSPHQREFLSPTENTTAVMVTSCSSVILDHTTLLGMTHSTLPLISHILAVN